ncbi:helix-turn-helix domain-containing protein [Enterobacter sp. RHBSTW-00901]|uniref:helix-turn-helix domain-containing protein n=1 Tax=Enterobacter sp. RHBSTW-00901 TaxID=2742669 RepID=UPI0015F4F053|nr:helix-turn-helix domain-containing protein [Enterobacter sp. RHBSTW-00901]MBA7854165.1 helix-turn-helix domain-containing protein [Enterobacter sp. RHBSTW-00901]
MSHKISSPRRHYLRATAASMRKNGSTLREIAEFLGVEKSQVNTLIKEFERCKGVTTCD